MPVETYEELIQKVKEASKLGYKFDYLNSNNLLVDADKQFEAIKNTIQIAKKYLEAMKRQNVKFNTEKPTIEFFEFVRSLPATFLCDKSDPNEKLKILQQKVQND